MSDEPCNAQEQGPDWAQIRLEFEAGTPPGALCKRYGVAQSTFYLRRNREAWARPADEAALAVRRAAREPSPDNIQTALATLETMGEHVIDPAQDPGGARARVLGLSGILAKRLQALLLSPDAVDPGVKYRDRTKGLLDIATTLERLQKIQRTALGLDGPRGPSVGTVVIYAPGKASEDDWLANVVQPNEIA